LIVLENTGHQIPFTRPDAVIDAIDSVAAKTGALTSFSNEVSTGSGSDRVSRVMAEIAKA
jgi:tRNA A37 threonylcarbamoyladenosine dehydratase